MIRTCTIAVLASILLAAPASAELTKDKYDELYKALLVNGEQWAEGQEIEEEPQLKNVEFDKESAEFLVASLRNSRMAEADLYVINRLLGRLAQSSEQAVQIALPAVKQLQARLRNTYRKFPPVSRRQTANLRMPDYDPRLTTDLIMGRMAVVDKQREAKLARDEPIARHNRMVYQIEKKAYRLMFRNGDPSDDQTILRTLFVEEHKGSALYLHLLDLIDSAAAKMPKDRAMRYQLAFRTHVPRLAMQKKQGYLDYGEPDLRPDESSTYKKQEAYPGIELLKVYKKLVKAAGLEKQIDVKVPDSKKIDEYHKKRSGRRR